MAAPALHGADGVFHGAVGGDHDDRQLRIVRANLRQNVHAIASRQGKIEQDQVERVFADALQAFLAAGSGLHHEAFHLQQRLQGFANLSFVVNDEHRARRTRAPMQRIACDGGRFRHELPSCSAGNPA